VRHPISRKYQFLTADYGVGSPNRRQDIAEVEGIMRLAGFIFRDSLTLDPTLKFQGHAIKLRSESFYCRIFADNFTNLPAVQSYLCGN
jgi:hypothetical protein